MPKTRPSKANRPSRSSHPLRYISLWGVLSIFLPICGLIWLFMKGHKQLGIYWIVAIVVYMIGAGIAAGSGAMQIPVQP